jgi:hypothetical protein
MVVISRQSRRYRKLPQALNSSLQASRSMATCVGVAEIAASRTLLATMQSETAVVLFMDKSNNPFDDLFHGEIVRFNSSLRAWRRRRA